MAFREGGIPAFSKAGHAPLDGRGPQVWEPGRVCPPHVDPARQRLAATPPRRGRALRRADLDVLFLFYLHQSCNSSLAEKDRYFASHSLMLVQQLSALKRENVHNDQAQWNRMIVGLRTPYPLDPETAIAVDAAMQNHLIPWEDLLMPVSSIFIFTIATESLT